jgi:hypothetical protein
MSTGSLWCLTLGRDKPPPEEIYSPNIVALDKLFQTTVFDVSAKHPWRNQRVGSQYATVGRSQAVDCKVKDSKIRTVSHFCALL